MFVWSNLAKIQFTVVCCFFGLLSICVSLAKQNNFCKENLTGWLLGTGIIYSIIGLYMICFAFKNEINPVKHIIINFLFIPMFLIGGLGLGVHTWIIFEDLQQCDMSLFWTSFIISTITWLFTIIILPMMSCCRCDSLDQSWTDYSTNPFSEA